jgi:dipeptidyl aminopeptidase/acylaminoacyl peptidase
VQAELGLVQRRAPDTQLLADAVAKGRQHALEIVWAAGADPEDETGSRLLKAEATAALNMLEDALGPKLMFRLMPRLLERPGALDLEALFDLDRDSPSTAWYTYLSQLTGEPIVPLSTFPIIAPEDPHLDPPPVAAVRALAPDDQIALTCDSRIWVGRADGSGLVPLTPLGDRFGNPRWSPDGRWLLVRRLVDSLDPATGHASSGKPAPGLTKEDALVHTLYRFDAQEPRSRALVAGPVEEIRFWDLSPDGRLLIYGTASDVRALGLETGEMRRLPAEPIWSPDGQQMVFSAGDPTRAWMAEADWGMPRQIAHPQGLAWSETQWSPDERRLAMHLNRGYPYAGRVAIYDLDSQKIEAEFALYDLIRALARSDGDYLSTGAAPTGTDQRSSTTVWSEGWSADGRYLLLRGDWTKGPLGELDYSLLVAFPLGGGDETPQVIAYGHETYMSNVAWSPADPQRLIFKWRVAGGGEQPVYETHLVDLETGSLYSTADATYAEWAPDGAGVALLSADRITFVDSDGRERSSFDAPGACTDIDWNPIFEYGALGTP